MNMSEKAREARKKYAQEYRRKNPEKMREYQIRYWEKKGAAANNQTSRKEGANDAKRP